MCLLCKEINPQSFEADFFSYLWSDYEGFHHRRSRISSALCWRRERFRCLEKHHLDRCVVALLEDNNGIKWAIASAHLSAEDSTTPKAAASGWCAQALCSYRSRAQHLGSGDRR